MKAGTVPRKLACPLCLLTYDLLLESKGILTREELLEKMQNIAAQMRKVET